MKKIVAILLTLTFLVVVPVVLAQTSTPVPTGTGVINININPVNIPGAIDPGTGGSKVSAIINNLLKIIFMVAALLVLIFLIIGAFQWIMSGGEKEAVGKARSRITAALIGLAILVLAFVVLGVIGTIVGIDFLNFSFPKLTQ